MNFSMGPIFCKNLSLSPCAPYKVNFYPQYYKYLPYLLFPAYGSFSRTNTAGFSKTKNGKIFENRVSKVTRTLKKKEFNRCKATMKYN